MRRSSRAVPFPCTDCAFTPQAAPPPPPQPGGASPAATPAAAAFPRPPSPSPLRPPPPAPPPASALAAGGVSTEPVALSFVAPPAQLAEADESGLPSFLLSDFSVQLTDWAGARAAESLSYECTASLSSVAAAAASAAVPVPPPLPPVLRGAPPPLSSSNTTRSNGTAASSPALGPTASAAASASGDSVLLLGAAGVSVTRGLALFTGVRVLNGTIGRSYPLSVSCSDGAVPLGLSSASAAGAERAVTITIAPCPAGKQSLGGRACEPCKAGTFNLYPGGSCRPCPFGAQCPGWDPALRATPLEARADWWRSGNASSAFFLCPLGTGGSVCRAGGAAGDAACSPGYSGPLCAVCADGYYMWGKRCRACDPAAAFALPFAGAVGALVLLLLLLWAPVDVSNPDSTVRLKIAFSLLQVLGLIKDYAIDWRGGLLSALLSYSDVLNIGLEITAPRCSAPTVSFFSTYLAAMATPFIAAGLCLVLFLGSHALRRIRGGGPDCDAANLGAVSGGGGTSGENAGGRQKSSLPPAPPDATPPGQLTPGDAVLGWLLPPWLDPRKHRRSPPDAAEAASPPASRHPTLSLVGSGDAPAPASPAKPLPAAIARRISSPGVAAVLHALPEEEEAALAAAAAAAAETEAGSLIAGGAVPALTAAADGESPRPRAEAALLPAVGEAATPPHTPPQPITPRRGGSACGEREAAARWGAGGGVRSVAEIALDIGSESTPPQRAAAPGTAPAAFAGPPTPCAQQPPPSARAVARRLFFADPAGAFSSPGRRGSSGSGDGAAAPPASPAGSIAILGGSLPHPGRQHLAANKPHSDSASSCGGGGVRAGFRLGWARWRPRSRSDETTATTAPQEQQHRRAASQGGGASFAVCLHRRPAAAGGSGDGSRNASAFSQRSSLAATTRGGSSSVAAPDATAAAAAAAALNPDIRTRSLKNVFWLLLLLYSGVSQKTLQLYGTRTTDTGAFLRADYSIRTRSADGAPDPRYSAYARGGAAAAVLFPLGLPLLFALAIRAERRGGNLAPGRCSFIAFATAGYREGWQYWEVAEMLRKLLMAAIGVFAWDGAVNTGGAAPVLSQGLIAPVLQPLLGQAVTVLHLGVLAWARPYARREHNALAAAALLLTWLPLLIGGSVLSPLLKELSQLSADASSSSSPAVAPGDTAAGGSSSSNVTAVTVMSSGDGTSLAAESQRAAVATALGVFLAVTVGPLVAVAVVSEAREAIRFAMRKLPVVAAIGERAASSAAEQAGQLSASVWRAAGSVATVSRQASLRLSAALAPSPRGASSSFRSAAGGGSGIFALPPVSPVRVGTPSGSIGAGYPTPPRSRPSLPPSGSRGDASPFAASPAPPRPSSSLGSSLRGLMRTMSVDASATAASPFSTTPRGAAARGSPSPARGGGSGLRREGSLRSYAGRSPPLTSREISRRWAELLIAAEERRNSSPAPPTSPRAPALTPPPPPPAPAVLAKTPQQPPARAEALLKHASSAPVGARYSLALAAYLDRQEGRRG